MTAFCWLLSFIFSYFHFYGFQLILLCRLAEATSSPETATGCHRFPSSHILIISSNIAIIIIIVTRNRLDRCCCFGFWLVSSSYGFVFGVWVSGLWMLLRLLAKLFLAEIFRLPFGCPSSVQVRASNGSVCHGSAPLPAPFRLELFEGYQPYDWQDSS